MADKMTLAEALPLVRGLCQMHPKGILVRDAWEVIDAHLAGMGEPAGCAVSNGLGSMIAWLPVDTPTGTDVYFHPPASGDWDKVRDVLTEMEFDHWKCPIGLKGSQKLHALANKLAAALPENAK